MAIRRWPIVHNYPMINAFRTFKTLSMANRRWPMYVYTYSFLIMANSEVMKIIR